MKSITVPLPEKLLVAVIKSTGLWPSQWRRRLTVIAAASALAESAGVAKSIILDPAQAAARGELQNLIARAKKGDVSALPRLRKYLADNDFLWRTAGNIGVQAQAAWAKLTCGRNLYLQECLVQRTNALKHELTGESPTPIEKLLVERIVTGWLQLGFLETREAQQGEQQVRWAEHLRRRQDQVFRQYMTSLTIVSTGSSRSTAAAD